MFKFPRHHHIQETEKQEHLDAMREGFENQTKSSQYIVEILFRGITQIDSKAQGLLAFNSLIIASLTLILTSTNHIVVKGILALSYALVLFSSYKALVVLNFEIASIASIRDRANFEKRMLALRNSRAYNFHISRFCAFWGLITFAGAVFLSIIIGVLPI